MSVFQNPHLAGRTGFGSPSRPPRGGMTRQDGFGDGVRQAIQQPPNMQMAPSRQAFSAYSPSQSQSQNSQSMAPARQAFAAYAPQQNYQQTMAQSQQDYGSYSQQPATQQPTSRPTSAPPSRFPAMAQSDVTSPRPHGAATTTRVRNAVNSLLGPEFAALQGKPRPVRYAQQPPAGGGNWMNDPNQRAAVGMGSGTVRPGEVVF